MAIVLRRISYGRELTADTSWQIYYGRHFTADIMRTTKTAISDEFAAPEAFEFCVRTCLLKGHENHTNASGPPYGGGRYHLSAQNLRFAYIGNK